MSQPTYARGPGRSSPNAAALIEQCRNEIEAAKQRRLAAERAREALHPSRCPSYAVTGEVVVDCVLRAGHEGAHDAGLAADREREERDGRTT